ncbi:hypothetical protein CDAR_103751 [Caerostris darwini]|uniref:Uncharacterized protein n=1 Tax=Caerostris darwini TaxID=1538125 RepID=A0AAV4USM5_9ARAC|nr:hypothetical protein CDAR_103751 [Caerostris darwini]
MEELQQAIHLLQELLLQNLNLNLWITDRLHIWLQLCLLVIPAYLVYQSSIATMPHQLPHGAAVLHDRPRFVSRTMLQRNGTLLKQNSYWKIPAHFQ